MSADQLFSVSAGSPIPETSGIEICGSGCTAGDGLFIIEDMSGNIIFGITYGFAVGAGVLTGLDADDDDDADLLLELDEVVVLFDELLLLEPELEEFRFEDELLPFVKPILGNADDPAGPAVDLGRADGLTPLGNAEERGDAELFGEDDVFFLSVT